jgi:hypothetical protein
MDLPDNFKDQLFYHEFLSATPPKNPW